MVKVKVVQDPSKKRLSAKIVLPLFLGGIMILSVFGVIIGSSSEEDKNTFKLKEYQFKRAVDGWKVEVNGQVLSFSLNPGEYSVLAFPEDVEGFRKVEKVYLSVNPKESYKPADRELYVNLQNVKKVVISCAKDIPECSDLPLKTCVDASSTVGVVVLQRNEANEYSLKENCFSVQGSSQYITKQSTAFLLKLFGIL